MTSHFATQWFCPRPVSRLCSRAAWLLCALTVLISADAFGLQRDTWKDVSPSSRNPNIKRKVIGCGYFWNADRGLLGSGIRPATWLDSTWLVHPDPCDIVSIYWTTDGGTNWTESTVPIQIHGAVTAISMVDDLEGYASIFSSVDYSYYRTWGSSALWKTTDGGRSWFDPFHLDHVATCVYAQKGLILFTQWDPYYSNYWQYPSTFPSDTNGGHFSFDGGLTWQSHFRRGNGIAFSDSLNGVVTEMNVDSGRGWGMNFWVTVDGGHTWLPTSNMYEAWSVYAIPGERTYFTAGESQFYLPHTRICRSTDGGFLWQTITTFPDIRFTGGIAGKGKTIYVQTDSLLYQGAPQLGMYRSDDLGLTWHWVGGPSSARDSRFVVAGCSGEVVYAFDARGGVWKTEDGGDGTLEGGNPNDAVMIVPTTDFEVTPKPCGDSVEFSVYSGSCVPITIDSVVQVSGEDLVRRSLLPATRLGEGDSAIVRLLYQPLSDTATRSVVRVYAHAGSRRILRDVQYTFQKSIRTGIILSKDSATIVTAGCAVADDSVFLTVLGCPEMVVDSVTLEPGELHLLSTYPDTLVENRTRRLGLLFSPDSSGQHTYQVGIHGHSNRRTFDTTITVTVLATRADERFVLSDSALQFSTKYCESTELPIVLSSTSCDSIVVDSVIASSPNFIVTDSIGSLPANLGRTLHVRFSPSAVGADSGFVRIIGHSRTRSIDTVIALAGVNRGSTQPLELSDTSLALVTSSCEIVSADFRLTNQGCDELVIDSVVAAGTELTVDYDHGRSRLRSNDTLPLTVTFAPDSGGVRVAVVRVHAHSAGRVLDTTITLYATNNLFGRPLAMSVDSVFLGTKYCHPIDVSIDLRNRGCPDLILDSAVVLGDLRHEFSVTSLPSQIGPQRGGSLTVRFDPDTSGRRVARLKLYGHLGDQSIDTVLELIGRNFTAPEPYLIPADSQFAGHQVWTPLYFRPTIDTFAIHQFSAHLAFNTDILTPTGLSFERTASPAVLTASVTEDATGARIDVTYQDSVRQIDNLELPVVWLLSNVALTKDIVTPVLLDDFSTDVEPRMTLCSVPTSQFTTLLRCADPIVVRFLQTGEASLRIASVKPNPVAAGSNWTVELLAGSPAVDAVLELYDVSGLRASSSSLGTVGVGHSTHIVATPNAGGDYFLVARTARGIEDIEKVTLTR